MQLQIDHHFVARILGMGRVGIGLALVLAPGRFGRTWIGAPASTDGGKMALRAAGARDIAIGIGTVRALDAGDPSARQWVTIAGACDLADSAATLLSYRSLPTRKRAISLIVAAGSAAAAFAARDQLD